MFDHLGFAVADFARSRAFYAAALAPLGMTVQREGEGWAAFGTEQAMPLWIGATGVAGRPPGHIHFAFSAQTRAAVRTFHAAAVAAGGADNGGPGLRPHYHPDYYAAFVLDPDGHNVEAVCRADGAEDQT